jgi:thioredoxin-disulfide reductase
MDLYDVIIVGGGPAGLTSALYTARKKLKTLIFSIDMGGQTTMAGLIENYPGVPNVIGVELMQKYEKQAKDAGAEVKYFKVKKIERVGENNKEDSDKPNFKVILSDNSEYFSKTIILGFGKTPRMMGIPGEEEFLGKGLSTCVTCDAPIYSGKTVAVIGGGNSALDGVVELSKIAKKVYIIHRRDEYRGDEATVEKVKTSTNIEELLSSVPTKINGDKFVTGVTVKNVKTEETKEIIVDGVFMEIGYIVDASPIKDLVKVNTLNEIEINRSGATSQEGVFAAGDCTDVPYKQTVISAGEGAKAALECHRFITGGRAPIADWK